MTLALKVKSVDSKLEADLYMKRADGHQYINIFITYLLIPNTLSALSFTVRLHVSIGYTVQRRILTEKGVYQKEFLEVVIEKEMKKVQFSKQGQNSKKFENGVPFVFT